MDKNVLVTGASRGIGKVIAKELKASGYNVFITARNSELLKSVAQEISADGFLVCDLSDKTDLEKLCGFVESNSINILVNNAGEYVYSEIEKMDYETIARVFRTNLVAPFYLTSKTVKNMKNSNWGRVVNIGSISGVMGEAYASLYSSSKAGLFGFTKALALELAAFGITVNTVNPGWVETELGSKSIEDSDFSLEETLETIPQRRFVEPQEVAKLVKYLISDDAKGVTGQSINLCAGLSVGI